MSEKPRMLWVARDMSTGDVFAYDAAPYQDEDMDWISAGKCNIAQFALRAFPDLRPGECRMFVEFAPRVVQGGVHGESLRWGKNGWVRVPYAMPGDIILPMPPDPLPYLTQAGPSAARRDEELK